MYELPAVTAALSGDHAVACPSSKAPCQSRASASISPGVAFLIITIVFALSQPRELYHYAVVDPALPDDHPMFALSRRAFLLTVATVLAAQAPPPPTIRLPPEPAAPAPAAAAPVPAATTTGNTLSYRGFTVDMSAAAAMPNRAAIETSLKKQIDIVADCGAKNAIMAFFRTQKISLRSSGGEDGGGRFTSAGIEIRATPQPPEKPIVLHELIHALHARYLPNANRNADVLRFFHNALSGQLYPRGEYVVKNVNEFFAVTASLYLWGYVARSPNNRETLRTKQPYYYAWLGELFGVKK